MATSIFLLTILLGAFLITIVIFTRRRCIMASPTMNCSREKTEEEECDKQEGFRHAWVDNGLHKPRQKDKKEAS